MAPERIHPQDRKGYDIRSDVWSLGITMCEMSIGRFPYKEIPGNNIFMQLKQVCDGDPPRLPEDTDRFSSDYRDFIVQCLQKDCEKRPNYSILTNHPIIVKYQSQDVSDYVTNVLSLASN